MKQANTSVAMALISLMMLAMPASSRSLAAGVKIYPLRNAYYGDLHLHTSYSFDAYLEGTRNVDPDEAYRFARGDRVMYMGVRVRRRWPLDFMAVTDHAENIGVLAELNAPDSDISRGIVGRRVQELMASSKGPHKKVDPGLVDERLGVYGDYFLGAINRLPPEQRHISVSAWQREMDMANRNYEPGKFTTFIAYEWTAMPYGSNLHRNVIFEGNTAPYPFTAYDSKDPASLWDWLERIRRKGFEALAIPHNANASNGLMYDWVQSSNSLPIDTAYAEERQRNEPLSEISQIKGASETNPLLSPDDEFANYEVYDWLARSRRHAGRVQGSYLRDALSRGLVIQRNIGVNPFKYGFVGGSDLHTGLSVSAQSDYDGDEGTANLGGGRATRAGAVKRLSTPHMVMTTSGNLTGVWAESNTRQSIYAALRRRETFATTGTRLKFRFFGGWSYETNSLKRKDWVGTAYAKGVPMGGDLPARPAYAATPVFLIWAVKDPDGVNLDRIQVIKVWEDHRRQREKIFNVVWSGARRPDPKTGELPRVGNTVDLKTGKVTNGIGSTELETVWKDPAFDPHRFAAYYLRVLEIPTPRWSTLLAVKYGLPLPKSVPATEQQRGWSSPIWYSPATK